MREPQPLVILDIGKHRDVGLEIQHVAQHHVEVTLCEDAVAAICAKVAGRSNCLATYNDHSHFDEMTAAITAGVGAPAVGVPTTFGTRSEVTSWATIWDIDAHNKYSLNRPDLYYKILFYNSEQE